MKITPLERAIADILWPPEDPEASWSPDTLDLIADAFLNLRPDLTPEGVILDRIAAQ